jgi:hypothetical protein
VGGFGENRYLRHCVKEKFGGTIQIIQPTEAWAAVAKYAILSLSDVLWRLLIYNALLTASNRGAVLNRLPRQPVVESVVSPYHYGVAALFPYDPLEDAGHKVIPHPYTRRAQIKKVCTLLK